MVSMVIGTFDSHRLAQSARRHLLDAGFTDTQIRIEGTERDAAAHAAANDPGIAARILNHILPTEEVAHYADAMEGGKTVLAVRAPDEAAAERAQSILDLVGRRHDDRLEKDVADEPRQNRASGAARPAAETRPPRSRVYPLPNAPTGWGEASHGEPSAIGILTDPARPDGLLRDVQGLGTSNRPTSARDDRQRPKEAEE